MNNWLCIKCAIIIFHRVTFYKISIIFKLWEDEVIHRYKIKQNYMLWYMRYIILFDYNHKIVS